MTDILKPGATKLRAIVSQTDGASASNGAHRARLAKMLRNAAAAGVPADRVTVTPESGGAPVYEQALTDDEPPDTVARDVLEAIDEDADMSGGGSYRVIVGAGTDTLGTFVVRSRPSSADQHEKRHGESNQDALIRQLMRHQEATMRLAQESTVRAFETFARQQDRQAARLEKLEAEHEAQADKRIERLRIEREYERESRRDAMQDETQREAIKLLAPLLPTVARKLLGAGSAETLRGSIEPGVNRTSSATDTPQKIEENAKSSAKEEPACAPPADAAARALDVLRRQPREAIEVLAGMLDDADARTLLASYDAAQPQPSSSPEETPRSGRRKRSRAGSP